MTNMTAISDAELATLRNAATRFGGDAGLTRTLQALTQPAAPHAAGKASPTRNTYHRKGGKHYLC